MKEEQIKQNALAYAIVNYGEYDEHDYTDHSGSNMCHAVSVKAFIADAHSRDEEIEKIKEDPWISVEEGLPEDRTKVLVQYVDGDCEVVWYRDKKFVCVVPDKQEYTGRAMVLVEGVMVEKPIFSVPKREVVTSIVTRWMQIPQLKKGGEK